MAKRYLSYLLLIITILISACSLCRYQAMKNAAWAYEEGYDVEYVMYSTSPVFSMGMFNAHVQATFKENGRRQWISNDLGIVSSYPDYPMGEYCWILTSEQYIQWLKKSRELAAMPMPPKEHRDKHWPKTKDVLR
ncbi:MAG: hypothetical protein A4E71_01064 [Smithella sp. PtaU1.Bin162]|nr:MAG: hypothetical protein A4E71_01064 [Smithella sp. PtaU1.Bin162]